MADSKPETSPAAGTVQRLPQPFKLERWFAEYEFSTRYLLCCSDCEPMALKELLALADDDSLARFDQMRLSYTESQGMPALREEIAKLYDTVTADQVVVCVPEEGVYLTMKALLQPGDKVVAIFPAYQSLHELAESTGCSVRYWEPQLPTGSGQLEFRVQDVLPLIQPGVKLVVVNFPHNPTGAMLQQADWQQLVAACAAAGAWLFSDEMYRFTEKDEASRLPSAVDIYPKAVTLCGLSKSWGLPGLRLGWVTSKDKQLLEQIMTLKDYTTICTPAPSELLALAAVRATPLLTDRCRNIISTNLSIAEGFFARWQNIFDWHPPQGGPLAFPRLKTGEDIDVWCKRLVSECGVLLLPASVYAHTPSKDRAHFRMSLGRQDMPECLKQLDSWCVTQYGDPDAGQ